MLNLLENSIKDIINKYDPVFFSKSNVTGIGLGYKKINGINTKEPCLHVMVEKKIPFNKLYSHELIPKFFLGIKTDVIEKGPLSFSINPPPLPTTPPVASSSPPPLPSSPPATSSSQIAINKKVKKFTNLELILKLQSKLRPIQPGCSISPITKIASYGTLGGIVFDNITNKPYILSNNHVLCDFNKLHYKTPIIQPYTDNASYYSRNDIIAYLSKGLFLTTSFPNNIFFNKSDAAIAEIKDNINYQNIFPQIGNPLGISEAKLDMVVKKIGASSGYSEGIITALYCKEVMNFGKTYNCYFENQINAELKNYSGDSGSLVLDSNNKVVGLFSMSSENSASFSPIQYILNIFNVHFKTL